MMKAYLRFDESEQKKNMERVLLSITVPLSTPPRTQVRRCSPLVNTRVFPRRFLSYQSFLGRLSALSGSRALHFS